MKFTDMGIVRKTLLGASVAALSTWLSLPWPFPAQARDFGAGPGEFRLAQVEQVTPDKLERWHRMSPEEKERIRERYYRWKELPPEKRERILDRQRKWRELPEGDRNFLRQRREIYRAARPEEKAVMKKFFRRWREMPPERRQTLQRKFVEWRDMPAAERDGQMTNWVFYKELPREERKVIRHFLFSEPSNARPPGPSREMRREGPPGASPRPPRD